MHRFKELEVWKHGRLFCTDIYALTSIFPESEKFGLTNQLRRAAVSIACNVAEGASRTSNKDFSRFLEIAIGSANEIETQLLIATDLGFIKPENLEPLLFKLEAIVKMLSRLRGTLQY